MKNKTRDSIVVGFALFSMFFGAGNLIFPPALGNMLGDKYLLGIVGFVLTGVGLPLLAILACSRGNGTFEGITNKIGVKFTLILTTVLFFAIGPLLAIPRTAATTFEISIFPFFPNWSPIIVMAIYFIINLFFVLRRSSIIDTIGKFLTPALLLCLGLLIVMGIFTPIGDVSNTQLIENNLFAEGVEQGYQTLDTLAAVAFSTVAITAIAQRGYTDSKEKIKLTLQAGVISGIFLAVVYAGLTYLGSMLSTTYGADTPQATLMVIITNAILGKPGKIVLGIIVSLACLTTSIGLTSSTATYFSTISNGKVKYESIVIGVSVFSLVLANFGVSTIIQFSAPILQIVCPVLVAIIATTFLDKYISNDNVFKGVAYTTLLVSILSVGSSLFTLTQISNLLSKLPLAQYGFNWVLPAILGGVVGAFIKTKSNVRVNKKIG